MNRSLSVFLPVQNAQARLEGMVAELLEVLPDLTGRFELLIVNQGSQDDTAEVAGELARRYPQVSVQSHATRTGRAEVLRGGLARTHGEIVLFRDADCDLDAHDLHKLWRLIDDFAVVLGRKAATVPPPRNWAARLWRRAAAHGNSRCSGGLILLHRQVAGRLCLESSRTDDFSADLSRSGYRWCEVQLRPATSRAAFFRSLDRLPAAAGVRRRTDLVLDAGAAASEARPASRPRYLDKIKQFALGE